MKENFEKEHENTALWDLIKRHGLRDRISVVNPDVHLLAILGGVSHHTVLGYMTGQFNVRESFIRLCKYELCDMKFSEEKLNEKRQEAIKRSSAISKRRAGYKTGTGVRRN